MAKKNTVWSHAALQAAHPNNNPKKEPRVTKSSVVRERILQAKQHNEQPDVVVAFAVEQLGMARPLARVYVKENWPKVEYAGEQQPETAE